MEVVEDIIMIGYPGGRYDNKSHLPIICKGSTATPYSRNYSMTIPPDDIEKDEIFIGNILGIEGQSGSPVLLYKKEI